MIDQSIFKAYDVRGTYPDQMDERLAYRIGRAFPRVLAELQGGPASEQRVAVGRDMRLSAPSMAEAYARGIADEGSQVLDVGMVGTEMLYWTVGSRGLDGGLMCTASHNPKAYTGAKLVKQGALALSGDSGIGELRDLVASGEPGDPVAQPGPIEHEDVSEAFREAALGYIDPSSVAPMRVVLDGGNGMAGPMVGPLLESFPLERVETYWRAGRRVPRPRAQPAARGEPPRDRRARALRGRGPGHRLGRRRRPLLLHRRHRRVRGRRLPDRAAGGGAAAQGAGRDDPLRRARSRAVRDVVERAGGTAEVNRVGHAFFKSRMRETGAAFGGEVSGHYYFRDFYCADSGTLPALLILELLSVEGRRMSELLEPLRSRYFISGEINSEVADQDAKMAEIAERYSDGEQSRLDGISVDYADWHFNVRPSNTEPLLRLNLESLVSQEDMEAKRDEVLGLIRS